MTHGCPPVIGIVGGYGAVGAAAAGQIAAWRIGRLRIVGRDLARAAAASAAASATGAGAASGAPSASGRPGELDEFARGCDVVINCAGPGPLIGGTGARAALDAGGHYVDAAGGDALYQEVAALDPDRCRRCLVSAGMRPGLTGVLPRLLAGDAAAPAPTARPLTLTCWVGGQERITTAAALDHLADLDTLGEAGAGWRDGRRRSGVTTPGADVKVPFFPGPVGTTAYLSTEAERLARALHLTEGTWYGVFDGPYLWQLLADQVCRDNAAGGEPDRAALAARLVRAAELDLVGRQPYQMIVCELAGVDGARTLVLRADGASRLAGITAAIAARAVLDGATPAGTWHAADALDPRWTAEMLAGCEGVTALTILPGTADQAAAGLDLTSAGPDLTSAGPDLTSAGPDPAGSGQELDVSVGPVYPDALPVGDQPGGLLHAHDRW